MKALIENENGEPLEEFDFDTAVYDAKQLSNMQALPDGQLKEVAELPNAFYRAGAASIANVGAMDVGQDFVLLKGITASEVNRGQEQRIIRPGGDKLGELFFFEIVAMGPLVHRMIESPECELKHNMMTYGPGSCSHLEVGKHIFHIASGADMVDPTGQGIYQLVRAIYVPSAWNPEVTRLRIHAMLRTLRREHDRARRENLGLPTE